MPPFVEREFAGDPRSAAAARSFAKAALTDVVAGSVPPALCDDLELVVSELVTNAVRAGSPTVRVTVEHTDDAIVVRVADDAPGWPEQRAAGESDAGGRGLPLVSAVSATWGVRPIDTGKIVWAALPIRAV